MNYLKFLVILALVAILAEISALAAGDSAKGKEIYMANCTVCHSDDPSKVGGIGPAIKGSSRALIEARVLRVSYPPGYKPKRATKIMPLYYQLKPNLDDLAAFLK